MVGKYGFIYKVLVLIVKISTYNHSEGIHRPNIPRLGEEDSDAKIEYIMIIYEVCQEAIERHGRQSREGSVSV